MFRPMRRSRQALPEAECKALLTQASSGVLAVSGDDGYPYAVPMSFVYDKNETLYFHCAPCGHKLDAIQKDPKASFCVTAQDEVHPERLTTYYKSVITFGKARILENADESLQALMLLGEKYGVEHAKLPQEIKRYDGKVKIIAFAIEHVSGKQAIELTEQ